MSEIHNKATIIDTRQRMIYTDIEMYLNINVKDELIFIMRGIINKTIIANLQLYE